MCTKERSRARTLGVLVVIAASMWSSDTAADVVTDWNTIAIARIVAANRPGPSGILDCAMVQAAVHDAVQAFQQRFESYNVPIEGASGSPVAAVAQAARDVLVNRFPGQLMVIDGAFQGYLAANSLLPNDPGIFVGQQAAVNIINRRANDGSFPANPEVFVGGTAPGQWRPTPTAFAPMAAPWLGAVVPFALNDSAGLLPEPPPPDLGSGEYTKAYNEVKAMGARFNSARTPEQTDLALFYSDNFLAQLNGAMRDIADAHLTDIGDTARLFALANIAAADAIINAWVNKRYYAYWRPSTAINEGDNDGNPHTEGDPAWLPLINNPPYPDYTSGANSITAAIARTLSHVFETDEFAFTVKSTIAAVVQKTRTYERFSDRRRCGRSTDSAGHSLSIRRNGGVASGQAVGGLGVQSHPEANRLRSRLFFAMDVEVPLLADECRLGSSIAILSDIAWLRTAEYRVVPWSVRLGGCRPTMMHTLR
jgi:hypothetical protein